MRYRTLPSLTLPIRVPLFHPGWGAAPLCLTSMTPNHSRLKPSRLILHLHQKQPARRRRRSGFGSVARFQQLTERLRRAQTAADVH